MNCMDFKMHSAMKKKREREREMCDVFEPEFLRS
jgi:hypothetical protein